MVLKKKLLLFLASLAGVVLILVTNETKVLITKDLQASPKLSRIIEPATLRATEHGPIVGSNDKNDTHVWFGIPYARPPIGKLRWREPQTVQAWSKEFEALYRQPGCLHSRTFIDLKSGKKQTFAGAEDCLYIDIWAPRSAAENAAQTEEQLPVVIWLNGGGDKIGASSYVSGYGFAGSQQVVFVSVNYRLAHLGFFYHRATRNTAETSGERSGNYGLLDIIHALNWVQNNIANFGGDSKNITVIGAGNAGSHASALIASPSAEGSFHKAIIQGGSMKSLSKSEAEHFHDDDVPGVRSSSNEVILDLLLLRKVASDRDEARSDINTMSDESLRAFLEGQSAESIIGVDDDHRRETGELHGLVPLPIRDGFVIPQMSLYELFSDPISYNNVPMIIGSNLHGAKSVMLFEPDYVTWILNRVPIIKDRDFFKMMSKLQSDLKFILGVQEPVKLLARSRRDVQAPPNIFVYRFDWSDIQSNLFGNWSQLLKASTSLELDFVLDNFHQREGLSNWSSETIDSERHALSMSIMDYWGSFVYTGNPSRGRSGTLEEWVPWQDRSKNTLLLDNSLKGQIRMEELRYEIESFKNRVISLLSQVKTTRKCKLAAETLQKSTASSAFVPDYSKWISYPSLCLNNQQ